MLNYLVVPYGLVSTIDPTTVFMVYRECLNTMMGIFNTYAVEIDYPLQPIAHKKKNNSGITGRWLNDYYYLSIDFKIDKLMCNLDIIITTVVLEIMN